MVLMPSTASPLSVVSDRLSAASDTSSRSRTPDTEATSSAHRACSALAQCSRRRCAAASGLAALGTKASASALSMLSFACMPRMRLSCRACRLRHHASEAG